MTRQRQIPRDLRSLWKRAGERAGDGAGALFARLDAQDERIAQNELNAAPPARGLAPDLQAQQARTRGAIALEHLASQIRAGVWNAEIAEIARLAERITSVK